MIERRSCASGESDASVSADHFNCNVSCQQVGLKCETSCVSSSSSGDLQFAMPTGVRRALMRVHARSATVKELGIAGSQAAKANCFLVSASAAPNPRPLLEHPVTARPATEC